MKNVRLNTDSFVDIVANTVGIVVILTLLSTLLSQLIARELMADRQRLFELEQRRDELIALRDDAETKIAEKRLELEEKQRGLGELTEQWAELQKDLAALREELEALQAEEERLLALQVIDAETLRKERDLAAEKLNDLLASLEPGVRELVENHSFSDVSKMVDDLVEQMKELDQAIDEQLARLTEIRARITSLQQQRDDLQQYLRSLREKKNPLVLARNPLVKRPYGSQPIYVECFTDKEGAARVRMVNQTTFERREDGWHPILPGETLGMLSDPESHWAKMQVSDGTDGSRPRYIYAVVRPNGYQSYRALRDQAHERSWWIEWDPIPAGDTLRLGR